MRKNPSQIHRKSPPDQRRPQATDPSRPQQPHNGSSTLHAPPLLLEPPTRAQICHGG
ncbi:expressed protein [Arabidopsis lyrata subsp. lyrata]|uniref:Expressed protein n=1 Tax=Arabidopsis lyrata subsp. lyrata TaxID=81972 RepID=D7KAI6_ARALL|nr:expressed protein [Arabidopsis lyrata subsp. lyrata]